MTEKTKLARAHSKNKGLKTTFPWSYVDELDVREGDFLIWEWRVIDGEKVLTIRKEKK